MQEATELLKDELREQEKENYQEGIINWIPNDFYDSWDKIKGHCKKLWNHKEIFDERINWKKYFLAHSKDIIEGKPQLISDVQRTIPLVRQAVNKIKDKESGEELEVQSYFFFDEKFDKRHDGFQKDVLSLDFRIYRIRNQEDQEFFIFSQEVLPNCTCEFQGMLVPLDDFAEMSRNLKIKSVSKIFFVKDFIPSVKILPKESLVEFTKSRGITYEDWIKILAYHELGNYNRFPLVTELLRSAFILSGKSDGWPLHLAVLGPTGTKKSMGYVETLAYKFSENPDIFEGGNSRIKGLSPSFKEKPANIGFIAKSERFSPIDELGKMIEFELNKHQTTLGNVLGELNFLLDHKRRTVGSGNDNDCEVQATAKILIATNPVSQRETLYKHVGVIDPTTMSRLFWWVQNDEEIEFVLSKRGLEVSPHTSTSLSVLENRKKDILLKKCWGKVDRNEFLTLFDSCYNFCCEIDFEKVQQLSEIVTLRAKEPMKNSVWRPRGEHQVKLLIDGLVKTRCLFEDYDPSFTAKDIDYERALKILEIMVNSWDTNLQPKEEFR